MQTVGMIGLGEMGSAMAERLLSRGVEIIGYDPDATRTSHIAGLGGRIESSPGLVAQRSDGPILLNVQTTQHAAAAWSGDHGLRPHMHGRTLVIMGTFGPQPVEDLAAEAGRAGAAALDAPHTGSAPAARSGTLTYWLAGAPEPLAEARPVLENLGATLHVIGDQPGLAQVMKLINAVGMSFNLSSITEMQRIADMYGIDRVTALRWIDGCSGSSWLSERMPGIANLLLAHNMDNLEKDLRAALEPAAESGRSLPVTSAILDTVRASWLGST
jgi:3-hydroxyisobutyrate dehydrogenase-like beta-hydroxyacid dehydrogenase